MGEALYRGALFVFPFALAFVWVVSLLAVMTIDQWRIVFGGMTTYLLVPVGTEVVVPAVVVLLGIDAAWYVVVLGITSVVLVDVFVALFVAWNWDLFERIPYLGGVLRRVEAKCHAIIARKKWGEGTTLMALAAYVALPVQMTGGLFGSVLGRVMGIDKGRVFLAVVAGSLAGAIPMGILAVVVREPMLRALESPTAQSLATVAGILITVAFVAAVVLLYRREKRNAG